jgi:hypothetical protein
LEEFGLQVLLIAPGEVLRVNLDRAAESRFNVLRPPCPPIAHIASGPTHESTFDDLDTTRLQMTAIENFVIPRVSHARLNVIVKGARIHPKRVRPREVHFLPTALIM